MSYILILIHGLGQAYQVIINGIVVKYVDINGNFLFDLVPSGYSSEVIDSSPNTPSWHVDLYITNQPSVILQNRRVTKLEFISRLGSDFRNILTAAKSNVDVELFVKQLDWATPEADGTSVDLDDIRVIYALNSLETAGLIAVGRTQEILNA